MQIVRGKEKEVTEAAAEHIDILTDDFSDLSRSYGRRILRILDIT